MLQKHEKEIAESEVDSAKSMLEKKFPSLLTLTLSNQDIIRLAELTQSEKYQEISTYFNRFYLNKFREIVIAFPAMFLMYLVPGICFAVIFGSWISAVFFALSLLSLYVTISVFKEREKNPYYMALSDVRKALKDSEEKTPNCFFNRKEDAPDDSEQKGVSP